VDDWLLARPWTRTHTIKVNLGVPCNSASRVDGSVFRADGMGRPAWAMHALRGSPTSHTSVLDERAHA
jgi:hypothetical protein